MVQGALKLILEPIFEADFQPGSYGYRPKQSAHAAVRRVAEAIVEGKTYVVDLDLKSYFDTVRHHIVLAKVARRVRDDAVLWLLRLILKASGRLGVPQGGVISPLLSNVYLTEVDKMLERAKEVTRSERWTYVEYARFADDVVVLVDGHPRHGWLRTAVERRLRAELAKLQVAVNEDKSRRVDLTQGESFGFLGFEFRRIRSRRGRWMPLCTPRGKKRAALLRTLKQIFRSHRSRPISEVIAQINPILRGWVQYFAVGHSSRCFSYIRDWVDKKIRHHLVRASQRVRLEAVEQGMAVWDAWPLRGVPSRPLTVARPARPARPHNPCREAMQERVVRQIRMLRAMRRELETGLRPFLHGHAGGNPGYSQGAAYGLPRQFPTLPGARAEGARGEGVVAK